MRILPVFLVAFILLALGGGAMLWFALKRRPSVAKPAAAVKAPTPPRQSRVRLPFKWGYVAVPLLVLLISVTAAAYFYHLLPERIIFGFRSDGAGGREAGRDLMIVGLLAPQVIFAFASAAVAVIVAKVAERLARGGQAVVGAAQSITTVMSNMVVLPQIILCYVTLDIFVFNAHGTRLPSVFLFAVTVIVVGGAVLGLLLLRAIQQARVVK